MNRSSLTLLCLALAACFRPMARPEPVFSPTAPARAADSLPALPTLPAAAIVEGRVAPPRVESPQRLITVRANNADAAALLAGIAREAGINLVVASDVRRRVTLNLENVTAMQAIDEILLAAELTIATPPNRALPAVVFYQLPVNVNNASAATIAARFGVSMELANFIVEAQRGLKLP